jgi:hypothetical protein
MSKHFFGLMDEFLGLPQNVSTTSYSTINNSSCDFISYRVTRKDLFKVE